MPHKRKQSDISPRSQRKSKRTKISTTAEKSQHGIGTKRCTQQRQGKGSGPVQDPQAVAKMNNTEDPVEHGTLPRKNSDLNGKKNKHLFLFGQQTDVHGNAGTYQATRSVETALKNSLMDAQMTQRAALKPKLAKDTMQTTTDITPQTRDLRKAARQSYKQYPPARSIALRLGDVQHPDSNNCTTRSLSPKSFPVNPVARPALSKATLPLNLVDESDTFSPSDAPSCLSPPLQVQHRARNEPQITSKLAYSSNIDICSVFTDSSSSTVLSDPLLSSTAWWVAQIILQDYLIDFKVEFDDRRKTRAWRNVCDNLSLAETVTDAEPPDREPILYIVHILQQCQHEIDTMPKKREFKDRSKKEVSPATGKSKRIMTQNSSSRGYQTVALDSLRRIERGLKGELIETAVDLFKACF